MWENIATLVEVSISNDAGLNRAEREKIAKYQGIIIEYQKKQEFGKNSIIPTIIETTRLMKNNFENYLANISDQVQEK